jgi:hypothetical protein
LLIFYHPPPQREYSRMSLREHIWASDPIGSLLFIASVTSLLLSLNWAAGLYAWSNAHVAAPLGIGLVLFLIFCLYGRHHSIIRDLTIYYSQMLNSLNRVERPKRRSRVTHIFQGLAEFCAIGIRVCRRGLVILQCSK